MISTGAYDIAETFLTFGTTTLKNHHSEAGRRMMVVNLANAILLQNRMAEAAKLLDKEDWTASNTEFLICVATVKGDIEKVLQLMDEIGPHGPISKEQFRSWPVFRSIKSNEKFIAKFAELFNEQLNVPEVVEAPATSSVNGATEAPKLHAIDGGMAKIEGENPRDAQPAK